MHFLDGHCLVCDGAWRHFDGIKMSPQPRRRGGMRVPKSPLALPSQHVFDNRVAFSNSPASYCLHVFVFVGVRRLLFVLRCTWQQFAGAEASPKKSA